MNHRRRPTAHVMPALPPARPRRLSILAGVLRILLVVTGCLLGVVGVVLLPVTFVLVWVGLGVVVGALGWILAWLSPTGESTVTPDAEVWADVVAVTVAGGLVLAGLVVLLGTEVAAGIAMLAGVALWPRFGRKIVQDHVSGGGAATAATRAQDLSIAALLVVPCELSTAELCLAWRRSYLALLDLPPGPGRCELVRLRGCLLDELERRDPAGLTRWLADGARAGSDPGRYLATDR